MTKRTITIPTYVLGFAMLASTAPFISTWMWYRLLFALCFLHMSMLGFGFLKAYAAKK